MLSPEENKELMLLEKKEERTLLFLFFFIIVILGFVVFTIYYFRTTTLNIIAETKGVIVPSSKVKVVQHLEGGIVDEILVKEGELVQINQPLVVLSKEKASSDFEEIDTRLKSIDLAIYRVESEKRSLEKITIPKEKLNFFDKNLVKFENEVLKSNIKSITNDRQGKKSTIKKAETNLKNLNKRLQIVKEQEEISEKLLKAEATNRLRHLELLRELSGNSVFSD